MRNRCTPVTAEHLPEGFPPDLPAPEPLPLADAKDAEALVDAVGEYTVRALYSKTWQLREAALMSIEKVLKGGGVQGHKGDLFKALSKALLRSVQDKVANVFQLTLQVIIICAACLHVKSPEFRIYLTFGICFRKRGKDYAFQCQFNEKPSIIPGCPVGSCGTFRFDLTFRLASHLGLTSHSGCSSYDVAHSLNAEAAPCMSRL